MDAAYRIRRAVAADVDSVVALERTIQTAPHWALGDYVGALSPADRAPGTRWCFLVAEAASLIVGFAVGRAAALEDEVLAELESVAVADSVRRAGMGRALCEAVIAWARDQQAVAIELEVRSRSAGPIALYKALGFATVGLRKRYYRDPVDNAVLMRLDLL